MTSGQVIGRHEVFEYTYRVGPADERKRIKLVVIQRREQRRKSLIAAAKYLERTPVRLRVNLHRAQYGDPEVITGTRQIPITLRRKVKATPAAAPAVTVVKNAPSTTVRTAPIVKNAPLPSPPISEPTRVELVDRGASPRLLDPPPVVVIPPSNSPTPQPPEIAPSLSRSSSASSTKRPKVKRTGSFTGFRRFPSLMGMIRRNSKSSTPPSVVHGEDNQVVVVPGGFVDVDTPPSPPPPVIIEERESELGSPIAPSARYGPPSVAGSGISRKPVPTIPESVASGRSRAWSFGRGGSSPRNKLVKASPRQVPLPDSIRQSDATGAGSAAFPVHVRQSAEYEPARSVTSRHTGDRSAHVPEYAETYLHDSPTAQTRSLHSLHDGSVKSRSIHDGASVRTHNTHNRSLHDLSQHNRSAHDLSMRTPSRHSHEASIRRSGSLHDAISLRDMNGAHSPSLREHSIRDPSVREHSIRDPSVHDHSVRDLSIHEHSVRDPSVREASIRDPSIREQSLRGGGSIRDQFHSPSIRDGFHSPSLRDGFHSPSIHSPSMSMREVLSDGDRENDHTHNYERGSAPHSRVGSPLSSRSTPPPLYVRDGSPSVIVPSHRGASPSLHAPSHRGASPSLHAPSNRGASPSLHAPSRVASPSFHSPSRHGSPPIPNESPNASLYAPSARSRGAESVASSKYPMSSINGRLAGARPKSPLSQSSSSNGSSRRTNTPRGPEITPVPMGAPSVVSQRTSASRNPAKSPLSRVASPPSSEAPLPIIPTAQSVAGSTRSGRTELAYGTPLPPSNYAPSAPPSTYAPTVISRAPSAAPPSRAPSAAAVSRASAPASRIPTAASTTSRAGSATPHMAYNTPLPPSTYAPSAISRAPSAAPPSRTASAAAISRGPSAAGISRGPSAAGITRAPSAAGVPLPPSVLGSPTSRAPSAAGFSRSASAAGITRVPSAAGTHRQAPSVSVSQRIPPSVIGSQRVPPSITGSAPSVTPSRRTPPPETEYQPAPSDIAPESESHGGQALRAQARLEGDKMAMFFQMSQQAHKEGDGARAKELADIGRQHQVRMQELHAEAAGQIFKEKNAYRDPNEIDLHGLYVKEALARLSQFIRDAPHSGETTLRVITGKGLHSDRGEAQIIPAVQEALRTKGLRHHTDEANSGVIVVELGPRSPVSD